MSWKKNHLEWVFPSPEIVALICVLPSSMSVWKQKQKHLHIKTARSQSPICLVSYWFCGLRHHHPSFASPTNWRWLDLCFIRSSSANKTKNQKEQFHLPFSGHNQSVTNSQTIVSSVQAHRFYSLSTCCVPWWW